jgi:hypothetical protein
VLKTAEVPTANSWQLSGLEDVPWYSRQIMYPVITAVLSPANGINQEKLRSNAAVVTSVYIELIVPGLILQTPLSAQSLF